MIREQDRGTIPQERKGRTMTRDVKKYRQVAHHTLYQISTATALVEGIYQGAVRVGTLREHGDLGLGTSLNLSLFVGGRSGQST
jgi:Alpha-acetolactate decarboxylase